jgi:Xaa-Pro dipeptidase
MVSIAERKRRYDALRLAMKHAGYPALIIAGLAEATLRGYVRYVSDWHLWGGSGYIVLPLDSEPVLILGSASQTFWANEVGWVTDVRRVPSMTGEIVAILEQRKLKQAKIGVVGLDHIMPAREIRQLQAALCQPMYDATALMDSIMATKSTEEIGYLEETSRIVARGLRRFREVLTPGKTERQVASEAVKTVRELGVLDGIAHISHKPPPYIRPPTDRIIDDADIIKFSMEFCGPSGYWCELAGIFSFREPPEREREIFETTREAFERTAQMMKPGTTAAELPANIQRIFREHDLEVTGRAIWDVHGIGANVIEPPVVLPDNQTVLQEGMALNMHPGLLVGEDHWGLYLQDNFIVTPQGGRRLSGWDHAWNVV